MINRKLYAILEDLVSKEKIFDYEKNFDTRLYIQKILYLITHTKKSNRISLPYRWTFYLRGPYCSDAAHMIYHINEISPEYFEDKSDFDKGEALSNNENERLNNFKKISDIFHKKPLNEDIFLQ